MRLFSANFEYGRGADHAGWPNRQHVFSLRFDAINRRREALLNQKPAMNNRHDIRRLQ